jgi:transposase-like protein
MSTKPRPAGGGAAGPRAPATGTEAAGKGIARPRAVLYTAKRPGRCPNCDGTSLSRKGSRTKKFETVQRWQCASCGRGFTPAPPELRAKTYPLRVILDGVTLYNLGYTLAEASAKLKAKSGYRVPSSTLAAWRYILVDDAAAGTTHYSHPQEGESADRPRNTRC